MTRTWNAPPQQGPDAQELGEQIRATVQRAVEQAQAEAAREAAQAAREAGQAAREAGQAVPPGTVFRVDEQGNIVPVDPGAGGVPVTVEPPPLPPEIPDLPDGMIAVSIAFFVMLAVIIVGWPIARAFGRRVDRRSAGTAALPAEQAERIARIEQAVDAMAIEVERISEGQRFVTRLLTDRALPEGQGAAATPGRVAEPLPVGGERR